MVILTMNCPKPCRRMPTKTHTTYAMAAMTYAEPGWEKVGSCTRGMDPNRLFTRMKKKKENSSGMKGRKSFSPMMSRPRWLRTKP